nr:TonB-dependent receptor [Spirochaetota bacterium]
MHRQIKNAVFLWVTLMMVLWCTAVSAQEKQIVLQGKVFSSADGRPVDFGTVIVLEARVKVYTGADGSYRVAVPGPGEYTVIIRTSELKMLRTKVRLTRSITRNFYLQPLRVIGAGITITGERDIQKVSRYTMTQKNLKEVPGSFGDSISALTSLPGVIRTDGFFGPLVIRGANFTFNRYYIDDIPIYEPMHFGGIHSVINNNIMREIDLYASAFPAEFGAASGSVININTVDDVQEFGGYTDIGLISASALIQAPILRNSNGELHFAPPSWEYREGEFRNAGYAIASGRIGYLSVFIPLIYEVFTGDRPAFVPEYWDYQMKMKYYFNSRNSVTMLLMGSKDYLKFDESDADIVDENEGDDPLLVGLKAQVDWSSHSQGVYYTYQPSEMFSNRIMAYAAMIKYYTYFTLTNDSAADWAKDFNVDSRPYIFGIRDRFKFEPVKKHLQIRGGFGYTYYKFTAKGKTILANSSIVDFDPGDSNSFTSVALDEDIRNHTLDGYLETKVVLGGLTFVPGARADYLDRDSQFIWDPRAMASYEFPTETIL